jgi:KipI family sensor histidine kinase inhibitor
VAGFTIDVVRTRPVGENGLLLEVGDPAAWYQALTEARALGRIHAVEIVPAASTVLLAGLADQARAWQEIQTMTPERADLPAREVTIPIHWDGEDFDEVARAWQADPATIVKAAELRVAFCGFAPGFAYLTGLAEGLHLPRRETPRTRVPKGALATAGPYVGVYPRATPGGWNLLGHTDITLFDVSSEEPALLTPGTRVRFTDA